MNGGRLAILGSTGSIGTQTLRVVDYLNKNGGEWTVAALVAGGNGRLLREQVGNYRPAFAALADDDADAAERAAATDGVDVVVHAVSGAAGLRASFAAARAGKRLCLANKESLVAGGPLLLKATADSGGELLPIDSEHSAIHQALRAGRLAEIERVILTASGGPFRDAAEWPAERLNLAKPAEAMNHPTWAMGGKNTLDSATLFNKALELIEACVLFDLPHERVEVVVHPQSIVHSMVEFKDGSTISQLSPPDMRMPIGYALTYPDRLDAGVPRMDWAVRQSLEFEPPDEQRFPALRLARRALGAGGTMPLVLNAANEVAGDFYRRNCLHFGGIAETVERTMDNADAAPAESVDDLHAAAERATRLATQVAEFVGR